MYPSHYPVAEHYASAEGGCRCHSLDLYEEHTRHAVSCVDCHERYVDDFLVPWDATCRTCHDDGHARKKGRDGS